MLFFCFFCEWGLSALLDVLFLVQAHVQKISFNTFSCVLCVYCGFVCENVLCFYSFCASVSVRFAFLLWSFRFYKFSLLVCNTCGAMGRLSDFDVVVAVMGSPSLPSVLVEMHQFADLQLLCGHPDLLVRFWCVSFCWITKLHQYMQTFLLAQALRSATIPLLILSWTSHCSSLCDLRLSCLLPAIKTSSAS